MNVREFTAGEDELLWARLRSNMAMYVQHALTFMPQPPYDYHGDPVPWCDIARLRLQEVRLTGGESFSLWFHPPFDYPDIDVWPFAEFEGAKIIEIGWTP